MQTSIESRIKEIKTAVKSRKPAPVYLLKGEESYYIDLICNYFEKNLIPEQATSFNMTVLYGKEASAEMIVSMCRQYPVMSDLRLVILKEAQLMDKRHWTNIMPYLKNPKESTVFVICYKKNFDATGKGFDVTYKNAVVKSNGIVIESDKLKDYQLPKWITDYIAEKKLSIDGSCPEMIADYLGNNLQKIANEIDKMVINLNGRNNITQKDIIDNIGISKDYNVFELQNALKTKDVLNANKIVNYFINNPKENPVQLILPIIFSFFTKLAAASQVPQRTSSSIAQAMGISAFIAKEYVTALNYYNQAQLFNIISVLCDYDLKFKGINRNPLVTDGELLREMIFKIIHA